MTDDAAHQALLKEIGYLRLEFVGMEERLYKLVDAFYTHTHPDKKEADSDG